jgi:hypothetical protein
MAHFAELDPDNIVIRVVVVANEDITGPDGQEQEALGKAFLRNLLGGRWVQCSYNGTFRGCYPGPGFTYDPVADVFVPPYIGGDNPPPIGIE